jgi:hypothetical protein
MNENSANGQGTQVSPTEGNPVATPAKDSNQPTPASTESKKDESTKVERKTIPYERFSDVTRKNGQLSTELKYKEQEIETLKKQLESNKGAMSSSQEQQVVDAIPDYVLEVFGEEGAARGKAAVDKWIKDTLDKEFSTREQAQIQKQAEEKAKKEADEKSLSEYQEHVVSETNRFEEENPGLDVNKFHSFIEEDYQKRGRPFTLPNSSKLDMEHYLELYQFKNPKAEKSILGLDKVAGKSVAKTEAGPIVYNAEYFRKNKI